VFDITLAVVHLISQAGEALDSYIQAHPKVIVVAASILPYPLCTKYVHDCCIYPIGKEF
jgi:hypothetical protein